MSAYEEIQEDIETIVFDKKNPYSVINVVNDTLLKAIKNVPHEVILLDEVDLRKRVSPETVDYVLRISFWREYTRIITEARKTGTLKKMTCANVYTGLTSDAYFYKRIMKYPTRMGYMITPMPKYINRMEALIMRFVERLDEIVEIPFYDKKPGGSKKPNQANIRIFMDAFKYLDERIKGGTVKRIESKNMNVNLSTTQLPETATPKMIDKMSDEIKKLEAELHVATNGGGDGNSDNKDLSNEENKDNGRDQ